MYKKLILVLGVLVMVSLAVAACQPAPAEPETVTVVETVVVEKEGETVVETVVVEKEVEVEKIVEVEVEKEPEPVDRMGGWLDTIIIVEEPSSDAAVSRLEAGDIDVFAYNVSEPDVAQRIFDSETLVYETAYGNYNDLTFMPSSGPEFNDGRLNPFYSDKVREAMNWLIDRDYIADEITGGLAQPRYTPINFASKDMALLAPEVAAINLKYAHNPEKAVEVIDAEMEAFGAVKGDDGKWMYNGEPVVLTGLIRVEDERLEIGDYVSNLLEDIGFTVTRDYKTSAEASPCWLRSDPDEGCAHFYTGGWVSTEISRDESTNFTFFYTPDGYPVPPWQAYSPSPEFYDVATKLTNSDFGTMEERRVLMAQALEYSLLDSQRIFLKDDVGVAPHTANIRLASDLSGSVYGSKLWSETIRFTDREPGGSMTIAMPSIMTNPWNPVGGSNWVYDMMPIRGVQSPAIVEDPFTGVNVPFRLSKAEVYVEEGLPVSTNLDWATLEFVPAGGIEVPGDAWSDWDAENQVFITASERFTETATAKSKVVMYYEDDYFDKVKWHDGSPITVGDHVIFMIMQFDPSKEASPIYDASAVPNFQTFMAAFKGWKIASEDPLVIEYYTDAYKLDTELNITNFRAASPTAYWNGQEIGWHALVPGWLVEANGEAAFSADKSTELGVDWMSYLAGPTLDLLKAKLDEAQAANLIPYEPTLGQYISAEEATARYANLQEWYRRYGHFWVNTGPYFIQKAFPVEGTLILQHNPDYPDRADRWDRFASAPIPEVLLDGPDRVTIGEEVVYDVFVDFAGEPYAVDDIDIGTYLVFDATGNMVETGDLTAVEDGYWTATLSGDLTGSLAEGSNQLAVIVVSKRALVPVQDTLQFVTAP
jgi:peptide/nickel transport system substrate-binding protein